MKKLFFSVLLILPLFMFSQEVYTFKSGGRVFENSIKLNPLQVREKFAVNVDVLKLYNAGRTKKTVGNILLFGGISTIIIKHISVGKKMAPDSNGNIGKADNIMYFVGAGMVVLAVPIKIGFEKKIKKSIVLMNENPPKDKVSYIDSSTLFFNSNGVGICLRF